jgi:hypothetical protein
VHARCNRGQDAILGKQVALTSQLFRPSVNNAYCSPKTRQLALFRLVFTHSTPKKKLRTSGCTCSHVIGIKDYPIDPDYKLQQGTACFLNFLTTKSVDRYDLAQFLLDYNKK